MLSTDCECTRCKEKKGQPSCRGGGIQHLKVNTPENHNGKKKREKTGFQPWCWELCKTPTVRDNSVKGHKGAVRSNSPFPWLAISFISLKYISITYILKRFEWLKHSLRSSEKTTGPFPCASNEKGWRGERNPSAHPLKSLNSNHPQQEQPYFKAASLSHMS